MRTKSKLTTNCQLSTANSGFTIIELLIVMVIIAILAGLSIFAMSGARESARDARRKADLEQIRSGLEIYKADCNNYPASLPAVGISLTASCPTANTYIQSMPADPSTNAGYCYNQLTGVTYELCTNLEDNPTSPSACAGCDSGSDTGDYKVKNP
ncbi:hypothetical protein A2865_00055 [Candidatus Woesebacteria bacterium RIFCSPHIGHO2_01_FULL_39_17]|uniref:Fimbrial protein pilin n=2 Tax=Candidatus Woeseibacteriota TaxID=1752722 RepID=A0A0G0P552_9BACT|nr:MAG: fimbrial protein pilin [Microgenomates group bacterium GW2011_GWC1_38_12]KKQ93249.1 MAG: fimbrial protein pilin [Candidatus Woesebacteria bacterium GW2011_GWB1_39_10b]OGM23201.1 MAG: hypothetical protein A2865_00055 [Candidatus Woesebacteria bacterium RIFCSPHIGHO2_01_FULL_39_17]OGM61451.1 MAG: hypothetical protein A3A52_01380 [Candidatus Woesebacteria bacterium RIFCSPLOWO2_01_FULL_39_14]